MWHPATNTICQWEPANGWPSAFNARDKIACTAHYEYLVRAKHFSELVATRAAIQLVFQSKYHGLQYSV
jgi:hypothetical protein